MADLHPGVAALAPLLGVWAGQGAGEYPTIAPFDYLEEVTFGHVGKPFLSYTQRTRAADDGRPMHAETGYLRVPSPGRGELGVAAPPGITTADAGAGGAGSGAPDRYHRDRRGCADGRGGYDRDGPRRDDDRAHRVGEGSD